MQKPNSSLWKRYAIGFVVVIGASVVGRLFGGGELNFGFVVKMLVGYGVAGFFLIVLFTSVRKAWPKTVGFRAKTPVIPQAEKEAEADQNREAALYDQVGIELATRDYHPDCYARAVAVAHGEKEKVEYLYVDYRVGDLKRAAEEREESPRSATADPGSYRCPRCGYHGALKPRARGSVVVCILLMCLYVLPGIVYGVIFGGYKGVCSHCGATILPRLK